MIRGVKLRRFFESWKHVRRAMCSTGESGVTAADEESGGISGSESLPKRRPQFGNRFLTEEQNVFQHNAWDNVQWDEAQEAEAEKQVTCNSVMRVPDEKCKLYEDEAPRYWDKFYGQHQNRFFKDRHWLFTEFPELHLNSTQKLPDQHSNTSIDVQSINHDFPGCHATTRFLEVGCGVGNTVFPILETNNDPCLFVYCCDFAPSAIQLVKEHRDYNPARCHAFVCDITDENAIFPFPENSLDSILMVFVLSAVKPDKMPFAIRNLVRLLKPGGTLLFRDYGRYDLAQLRFKKGQCLGDNFYVRGDGTRVYFFTQDELRSMFTAAGLVESFNIIDRRLQVNRSRQLKMYRVWIQCKYVKSDHTA